MKLKINFKELVRKLGELVNRYDYKLLDNIYYTLCRIVYGK